MSDFTEIDGIVAKAVGEGQVPGVVSAVAQGDQVHVATAGSATIGGPAVGPDTLFRLASVTKPMTAATVLSQVDGGLLALDEPIEGWLPELAGRRVLRRPDGPLDDTVPADRRPTVRDLLTNTWGLGMQGAMLLAPEPWPILTASVERELHTFGPPAPGALPDPDTWLARLGELPLLAQPGERWLYQTSSQVLGVLAGRVDGSTFDVALRDRVLAPLGMTDTGFHTARIDRLASAYRWDGAAFEVTDPPAGRWSRQQTFADGGAGLVSTVGDVVRFGRMLLAGGGPVLAAATVAEMTRGQLTPAQRAYWPGFDLLGGRNWGYGLSVLDDGACGWDGGAGTTWSNVPAQDLTVVTLTQREWDETGPPAVCADVLAAARAAAG